MYYVYRFLDKKNNIIYVGKSKQDLEQRFRGHRHLPDACYDLTYRIEYIACYTESDMAIKEIYYINKFRHNGTFFNVLDTSDVPASVEFTDTWQQYKGPLGSNFPHSINYSKEYTTQKEVRYNLDGSVDQRRPNKESGISSTVDGLTPDEVNLMVEYLIGAINSAQNDDQERIRFRNLMMFVLSVNLPHKTNDFLGLKYRDFFDERDFPKTVDLILGRFHKDAIIPIPLRKNAKTVLMTYTKKYGINYAMNAEDGLFLSRKHQAITPRSWWKILNDTAKSVGIHKNIGAESPRKTYALNIYNHATDKLNALLFLGELWGRVREAQIIKYLDLTDSEINFDYYLGETFSLGDVDISRIDCLNPPISLPSQKIELMTSRKDDPKNAGKDRTKNSKTAQLNAESDIPIVTTLKTVEGKQKSRQVTSGTPKQVTERTCKKDGENTTSAVMIDLSSNNEKIREDTVELTKSDLTAYEYLGNLLKRH